MTPGIAADALPTALQNPVLNSVLFGLTCQETSFPYPGCSAIVSLATMLWVFISNQEEILLQEQIICYLPYWLETQISQVGETESFFCDFIKECIGFW